MTEGDRITCRDMMSMGFCMSGQKKWFEGNGFDFREVVRNGVTDEELLRHRDAYVDKILSNMKERRGGR